jgi:hypothetical protein
VTLSAHFLLSRARRFRHLAAKAKVLADSTPIDAVTPRLTELSDKLSRDADRDEEEARTLLAEEADAPAETLR